MEKFRSAFTKGDLLKADVVCLAGQSVKLGEYVVPAGEAVSIGYGQLEGQESAVGRILIDLQAVGGNTDGTIRISSFSPQNRPKEIIKEFRTEVLRQSATDRTKQVPLAEHELGVTEDKKIVVEFIADVNVTVLKATSTILMDITKEVF